MNKKKSIKPCKLFYDMQAFGLQEFEFSSWKEAFDYWREENPPGPLVHSIYLLNLTHHNVFVSPPGHEGNAIFLHSSLGWLLPDQSHDPELYKGRHGMLRGHRITNESFSQEAYNKAVEDKEWDDIYFRKTGKHWQGRAEQKGEAKTPPDTDRKKNLLDRKACLEIFGLKPGFSKESLDKAYKRAVKMNHPDKVAALSKEFIELAECRTKQINQAYELLKKTFR